jgi:hypothetical protein
MFLALLFTFLALIFHSLVLAGDSHYSCTVISAGKVTGEGGLDSNWAVKSWIGQQFTVDRETGRIIGEPLDNAKLQIQVLDKGSRKMSFQVFSQSREMSHSTNLQIEEFQATENKPFIATTTLYYSGVYSGICR